MVALWGTQHATIKSAAPCEVVSFSLFSFHYYVNNVADFIIMKEHTVGKHSASATISIFEIPVGQTLYFGGTVSFLASLTLC